LLRFFREGGAENLSALLRRLSRHAGSLLEAPEPRVLPRTGGYIPGEGAVDLERLVASCPPGRPRVPIIFYRAMLLASDTAAIDALCAALAERADAIRRQRRAGAAGRDRNHAAFGVAEKPARPRIR
jgi:cobaltochelatase CobN